MPLGFGFFLSGIAQGYGQEVAGNLPGTCWVTFPGRRNLFCNLSCAHCHTSFCYVVPLAPFSIAHDPSSYPLPQSSAHGHTLPPLVSEDRLLFGLIATHPLIKTLQELSKMYTRLDIMAIRREVGVACWVGVAENLRTN